MAKIKTYEYRKRVYSEVPAEIVQALGLKAGDELEFKLISGRVAALFPVEAEVKPEEAKPQPKSVLQTVDSKKLPAEEQALVSKISSIKYYDRLTDDVLKKLSARERELFDTLVRRKVFFKYIKNKKEFIGVSRDYFPSAKPGAVAGEGLLKDGFAVLETQAEADRLSRELEKAKTPVKGIRSFDRKYYLMTEEKLREFEKKFEKILNREKPFKTIAEELGEKEGLTKAALEILREDGVLIEKKKDTYALA